jgi:hypothetical protein
MQLTRPTGIGCDDLLSANMKTKEEMIEFEMNYCQHYAKGKGADMLCKAGMDLKTIKKVPTGKDQIKWGPCIGGHTLANPNEHCPHWIRRTQEMGEKRYTAVHRAIHEIEIAREAIGRPQAHGYATPCDLRQREITSPLWYRQSGIQPVVDGLPGGLVKDQLTAIGNSLVPQVALIWLRAIQFALWPKACDATIR